MNSSVILRKTDKYNQLILICLPLVFLVLSEFVLGFNGLYGQDSHAYLQYSKVLLGETQNVVLEKYYMWPKAFPWSGAILSSLGIPVLIALRLVSLVSFVGSIFIAKKIIQQLYNKDATLLLVLGAMTQIYFLRIGYLVMSDSLAVFFSMGAIYFFIQHYNTRKLKFFIALILFAVLAFYTRYATAIVLCVPIIVSIYLLAQHFSKTLKWLILVIIFGAGLSLVLLNSLFLKEVKYLFSEWSLTNIYSFSSSDRDGISARTVPNGLYVFGNFLHLGFLSFGALLLFFYRKTNDKIQLVLIISLAIYFLFLSGMAMQNYRFLALSHLIVLILLFPSFSRLITWLKNKRLLYLFIVLTLTFNIAFGAYSFRKTYASFSIEKQIVEKIKQVQKGEIIYSFYVDQSFSSYGINNPIKNFFYQEYTTFDKGSLVVFNPEMFRKQWKGKPVMNNWKRLTSNYRLDTIAIFDQNWMLYRIK